jgi:hypothetical protein
MYEGDLTPEMEKQAVDAIRPLASNLSRFGDLLN